MAVHRCPESRKRHLSSSSKFISIEIRISFRPEQINREGRDTSKAPSLALLSSSKTLSPLYNALHDDGGRVALYYGPAPALRATPAGSRYTTLAGRGTARCLRTSTSQPGGAGGDYAFDIGPATDRTTVADLAPVPDGAPIVAASPSGDRSRCSRSIPEPWAG